MDSQGYKQTEEDLGPSGKLLKNVTSKKTNAEKINSTYKVIKSPKTNKMKQIKREKFTDYSYIGLNEQIDTDELNTTEQRISVSKG